MLRTGKKAFTPTIPFGVIREVQQDLIEADEPLALPGKEGVTALIPQQKRALLEPSMAKAQLFIQTRSPSLVRGALAGLVGGFIFTAMMLVLGMLPMIASLIGSSSALLGFIVHMNIAAIIGAIFGAVYGEPQTTLETILGWGGLYGFIWWILGPLLIMPFWLGMPLFMINDMIIMSFVGHLTYGLITSAVYFRLLER
jgi:hypothetical protein